MPKQLLNQLPDGFRYAGVASGVKASGKLDLALIVTDRDAIAAGVYTTNIVHASSIDWNRDITPTDQFRGLVINSGNANACTGQEGEANNQAMAEMTARLLEAQSNQVCVFSTGVIGHQLPMKKIEPGITAVADQLGDSYDHFNAAAEAILTTDKGLKTASRIIKVGDQEVTVVGMAKGAGMIGPKMATMLAVVMTDAAIDKSSAQTMTQRAADASFNRVSVEGHMSTNDGLILIASGKSSAKLDSVEALNALAGAVEDTCIELARQIPADGEGATHLVEISISGARSETDADKIARAIASSNLVKTAVTGNDPNWGRIVSAAGYCGADFEMNEVGLKLNGQTVFEQGQPVDFSEKTVSQMLKDSFDTLIELNVGSGPGNARHWTSDLTTAYVEFNSEYTT
ncbi:bifunctional glutamate N-acetyltransferase/amino-acid acetyltransferase ArgJ [Mariniblastus sp.]|nr:bifunctional glutamate N-acetyltransferase/amino-acid acetyltransferase ArgJ [Mariniblastus sp.]